MEEKTKNNMIAGLGYILAFIIPLIGFLYGLILFYRKKEIPFFNRQSKIIMIFAIFMWILGFILNMMFPIVGV